MIDRTYGRIPVLFPNTPYPTRGVFAAYITSYLPSGQPARSLRNHNLHRQLRWWRLMTDMPVHVVLSNWTPQEIAGNSELALLGQNGGNVIIVPPQALIHNRIVCLQAFYASGYAWGVIMDDDAILFDSHQHNSGAAFFSEMARNDPADYADVDVFFPINPAKLPGQNQIWEKDPQLYTNNHVFDANYDLKGSLFVVRNFAAQGRTPIIPPAGFIHHGEDTLFAIEAVSRGSTVFRCGNIVLKEFSAPSHFQHSRSVMQAGNQVIAQMYSGQGLRMDSRPNRSHLLDRSALLKQCLAGRPRRVVVQK
jgi:hypothetical protein